MLLNGLALRGCTVDKTSRQYHRRARAIPLDRLRKLVTAHVGHCAVCHHDIEHSACSLFPGRPIRFRVAAASSFALFMTVPAAGNRLPTLS